MQNRPRQDYSQDETKGDSGVTIVECPNCKGSVPLSIYCLKCGYPMFELMKEHMNDGNDGDGDTPDGEEFRLEPEDVEAPPIESPEPETEAEPNPEEREELPEELHESAEIETPIVEVEVEEPPGVLEIPDTVEEGPPSVEEPEEKLGFEADEALVSLMRNLANSINMKLWSVGQLLEGRISEQNFARLHEGYDAKWRQLMDQRNERLAHARDLDSLEEGLERAYIDLGELEVRKTLDDLYDGEYEAKAPAYEWEISHREGKLEMRRGEIAFLERLSNVVPREEMRRMAAMARGYLEEMRSSEGLMELINGTYGRLKTSMEEILAFLEENE